jgi:hypothetical protein
LRSGEFPTDAPFEFCVLANLARKHLWILAFWRLMHIPQKKLISQKAFLAIKHNLSFQFSLKVCGFSRKPLFL